MFHWLTDRRRRKLTEAPFPEAWEEIVKKRGPLLHARRR
jgi:hypothetical protein